MKKIAMQSATAPARSACESEHMQLGGMQVTDSLEL